MWFFFLLSHDLCVYLLLEIGGDAYMNILKTLSLSFVFSIISLGVSSTVFAEEPNQSDVIINFKTDIDYSLLSIYNAEIIYDYNNVNSVYATIPTTNIKALSNSFKIQSIVENQSVSVSSNSNDSLVLSEEEIKYYNTHKNYAQDKINAKKAWDKGIYGKGVKVAIIDSGIDLKNSEVKPKKSISFITEKNGDNSAQDYDGHGTFIASLIAGTHENEYVDGVAPKAELYVAKVLDSTGSGYYSSVIQAIDWAISQNVDVINLSLGNNLDDAAVHNAIQKATEKGIIIVAGAGNKGTSSTSKNSIQYPAKYDEVIAIGSTNYGNQRGQFSKLTYSATGEQLDFVAPGVYNVGVGLNGDYIYSSGTSNSTAIATGLVALYLESDKSLNSKNIRSTLANTSLDLGDKGKDTSYGYGLLQFNPDKVYKASTQTFSDVPTSHWAFQMISLSQHLGLMKGKNTTTTFAPNDLLTRAEAASIFNRLLVQSSSTAYGNPFSDVSSSHWAYKEILVAVQKNTFSGYNNGTFKPDSNITRAEIASVVSRVINKNYSDSTLKLKANDLPKSHWAYSSINVAFQNSVITGYSDGSFKPDKNITRAEMATILQRLQPRIK